MSLRAVLVAYRSARCWAIRLFLKAIKGDNVKGILARRGGGFVWCVGVVALTVVWGRQEMSESSEDVILELN